jgi:polysaccharide biosynthesis transport protein
MGAMMRRLERKISVAEDEYLSLVKNLGLAKLKQQSVEVSSANTILDPPLFPAQPQPGKRKILILAAAVIGLLITLLIILILDLMDSSLRNASKASKETGLEVESIFPVIRRKKQKVDIAYLEKKSVEAISRKLILQSITAQKENTPVTSIAFSTLEKEGKSFLLQRISSHLTLMGYKVLLLHPHEETRMESTGFDTARYIVSKDFYLISSFRGLETPGFVPEWEKYHFIFVEFPGILHSSFPVNLFKTADHCFLVCRANRAWAKADANILDEVLAVTDPVKPKILLNGVVVEEMESLVGELPRKRSKIRIFLKRFVKLQFSSNQIG